jgi:hypothetical protein
MKSFIVAAVAVLAVAVLASSVYAATAGGETLTLRGTLIDNACAGSQTPEQLAAFIKTHTKECALMPGCAASGYGIFADGLFRRFDAASNAKVEAFLRKEGSKLEVVVVAREAGGRLELVSIENQM